MKDLTITSECSFECEMVVTKPTLTKPMKIKKFHDESIGFFAETNFKFINLSDFRDSKGQTIGEFILSECPDFAMLLALKENRDLEI